MDQFELLLPDEKHEAVRLLSKEWDEDGGRRVSPLAGGQDLLTSMKEGLETPDQLVSLQKPSLDLRGIEFSEATKGSLYPILSIKSMTTVAEVGESELVRVHARALAEAASSVGSPQIRNRATVGGNLCQRPRCWYFRNSDAPCLKKGGYECFAYGGKNKYNAILGGGPSYIVHPSDIAPALVMLKAMVSTITNRVHDDLSSLNGRNFGVQDLYTLPSEGDVTRETVLHANELITGVVLGVEPGLRTTYMKAQERGSFDFALSAVALGIRMEGDRIAECRLVLGSVAPIPWRCEAAEELAVGRKNDEETWAAVAEAALEGAEPLSENAYKVPLTKGLIEKAMRKLAMEES